MKKMNRHVSLPVLLWRWLRATQIKVNTALFRHLYGSIHREIDGKDLYTYWVNILQCRGGGEKMMPCEYFFPTPMAAHLHREIVEQSPTWEYVTTVKVLSEVPLSITDYENMLRYDETYRELVEEMTEGVQDTANKEMLADKKRIEKTNADWMAEVAAAKERWEKKHRE